jgi:ArsR family transcriptional regulator
MDKKKSDSIPLQPDVIAIVQDRMPEDYAIERVSSFFKVLGDSTRIRILYALKEKEMCAGDIAVLLDMTKSAVSHQLAIMRNMHQIRSRREGKNIFYSLDDQHIVDIIDEALIHMTHVDK